MTKEILNFLGFSKGLSTDIYSKKRLKKAYIADGIVMVVRMQLT